MKLGRARLLPSRQSGKCRRTNVPDGLRIRARRPIVIPTARFQQWGAHRRLRRSVALPCMPPMLRHEKQPWTIRGARPSQHPRIQFPILRFRSEPLRFLDRLSRGRHGSRRRWCRMNARRPTQGIDSSHRVVAGAVPDRPRLFQHAGLSAVAGDRGRRATGAVRGAAGRGGDAARRRCRSISMSSAARPTGAAEQVLLRNWCRAGPESCSFCCSWRSSPPTTSSRRTCRLPMPPSTCAPIRTFAAMSIRR